jgi:O-antigen/teichoic acid export membrane protein
MFIPSFQFNSKKNYSLLFNVEINIFFLALSFLIASGVADGVATSVAGGGVVVGGSLCYYTSPN